MAENNKATNLKERLMQAEANRAQDMQRKWEEKQSFVNQLKALTADQRTELLKMAMRDGDGAKILSDNLTETDELVEDPKLANLINRIRQQATFSSDVSSAMSDDKKRTGVHAPKLVRNLFMIPNIGS